jgi:hypothetical protein
MKTEVEILWRFRLLWLLVFLYPVLFSRFVTAVLLASVVSSFLRFVLSCIYADILRIYTLVVLQFLWWFFRHFTNKYRYRCYNCGLIIFQGFVNSILTAFETGSLVCYVLFSMARHPLLGQGRLIIEASRSHSYPPHSVGLLWTSDQPDAETSTWQHTTITTDRHPCLRRVSKPQSQQASHALDLTVTGIGWSVSDTNIIIFWK